MESITRPAAQPDGYDRVTVMSVLRDLVRDHSEQQTVFAKRGKLQHAVATVLQHAQHIR